MKRTLTAILALVIASSLAALAAAGPVKVGPVIKTGPIKPTVVVK